MNRIESLRKSRGWKQEDLAKLLNVKRAAISKYETEKIALSADTIKKLCEIFGVSSDYLLCFSDTDKKTVQKEQPFSDNCKLLIQKSSTLSDEEIRKTLEYVEFLKSQRK